MFGENRNSCPGASSVTQFINYIKPLCDLSIWFLDWPRIKLPRVLLNISGLSVLVRLLWQCPSNDAGILQTFLHSFQLFSGEAFMCISLNSLVSIQAIILLYDT